MNGLAGLDKSLKQLTEVALTKGQKIKADLAFKDAETYLEYLGGKRFRVHVKRLPEQK